MENEVNKKRKEGEEDEREMEKKMEIGKCE